MNSTRRALVIAMAVACVSGARAAEPKPLRRIGVFYSLPRERSLEWAAEFEAALLALGWKRGVNFVFEWRFATIESMHGGTRADMIRHFDELAADLVRTNPDVIVAEGTPRTRALQRATRSIPIVTGVADAVGSGFAESLARPGANITGLCWNLDEIAAKQIGLMKQVIPGLVRVDIITRVDLRRTPSGVQQPLAAAGRNANVVVEYRLARGIDDYARLFKALSETKGGAAHISNFDPQITPGVVKLALETRTPTFCEDAALVEAGALMSFTLQHSEPERRKAAIVDKVLRGVNPGEIPFDLPTKSVLAVNRRTAKAIGISIPDEVLLRADLLY